MTLKFFDKVTQTISETDSDWLGYVNAADDFINLLETYNDPESTISERALAKQQFNENLLSALGELSPIGAVLEVESTWETLSQTYDVFDQQRTVSNFATVVSAMGSFLSAMGGLLVRPSVEFAGVLLTSYGIVMREVAIVSEQSGFGAWFYDFEQSITQADAKTAAEGYALTLTTLIAPGSVAEGVLKVFIDASKNNDTGIGESVEYIKNIRRLLGLGAEFTAENEDDVFDAVQDTREAIQTLYGDSDFQISGISNPRNDLSAFLSLYYLVPFSINPQDAGATDTLFQLHSAIAEKWNADRNLSAQDIADGKASFSDQYLADRAAMLGWVTKSNVDDTFGRADGLEVTYKDIAQGINLSPILNPDNVQQFVFGDGSANTITGGASVTIYTVA